MKNFFRLSLLLAIWGCTVPPALGQLLDWTYENIITDKQESGANPDLVVDASGNLHMTYWRVSENRLAYAVRDKISGQWTHSVVDPESNFYGYRSALLIDTAGVAHIAYIKDEAGRAFLRYAHNSGGTWTVESPAPNQDLGVYGVDLQFPRNSHTSLDLQLQINGEPMIVYFDGETNFNGNCSSPIASNYLSYDLDMHLVARQANGSWQSLDFTNIPDQLNSGCLPEGDRFGEFCQFLPTSGNQYYVVTNSLHNHDLLLYRSAPGDPFSWTLFEIDSTMRELETQPRYFREGFEYIDASYLGDSSLHLVYGISNLYGFGSSPPLRKRFIYTHLLTDSLGSPTYAPYHFRFTPNIPYRSYYSITTVSDDSIYIAYYDFTKGVAVLTYTSDQGINWAHDTLQKVEVNTAMQLAHYGDSLFLVIYDAAKDQIDLHSRKVSGGAWRQERATTTELRGESLASEVRRQNGQDEIALAFTERSEDRLYYGLDVGGGWTFSPIDTAGLQISEVALRRNAQGEACIVYAAIGRQQLRHAYQNGGNWVITTVADSLAGRSLDLETFQGAVHIAFFDLGSGALKHASSPNGMGNWSVEWVDSSSFIVGQKPDLLIDANGTLHLAYLDVANAQLAYASKAVGGSWIRQNISEAQNYNPTSLSLKFRSNGLPVVAFRDGATNSIVLAEADAQGDWNLSQVISDQANLLGNPIRMVLDAQDRPWLLYNVSGINDGIRLLRRDLQGVWHEVSVLNNEAEISGVFDFHLIGLDFYVIGKKGQLGNPGLGLLYASEGITTRLSELAAQVQLSVRPNPSQGQVQIQFENPRSQVLDIALYNLSGQKVLSLGFPGSMPAGPHRLEVDLNSLPAGVYVCKWQSPQGILTQKLVLLP